jgi:hypothetical protein
VPVVDEVAQVREQIDPRYVLGKGKLDEVVLRAMQRDADVLIFDRNLSPSQARPSPRSPTSRSSTARSSSSTSSRSAPRPATASSRSSSRS